jgi:hypothetical protein
MGSRARALSFVIALGLLTFGVQAAVAQSNGMWLSRTVCTAHEPAKKELHCGQIHVWHERGVLRWVKNHRILTIEASDAQVAAHYAAMQRNHLWLLQRAQRWVQEARHRLWLARQAKIQHASHTSYTPTGSVPHIICAVFGSANCSEALYIARRESGFETWAANGQYLGLFQMGSSERATYATIGYSTAYQQTVAAHNLFLARGWEPWTCCEG